MAEKTPKTDRLRELREARFDRQRAQQKAAQPRQHRIKSPAKRKR